MCLHLILFEMIWPKGHVINTNQHNYDRWLHIHKYKMVSKCKQLVVAQQLDKTICAPTSLSFQLTTPSTHLYNERTKEKKIRKRNPFEIPFQ